MNFTEEQVQSFFTRIDTLKPNQEPKFGQMNVNQMVCHCTDFFRMANGTKKAQEYGIINPKEILQLLRSGQTAPTPIGFGQTEGHGTSPTNLEKDKIILKEQILEFSKLGRDFELAQHPYFGDIDYARWIELANYHLNIIT